MSIYYGDILDDQKDKNNKEDCENGRCYSILWTILAIIFFPITILFVLIIVSAALTAMIYGSPNAKASEIEEWLTCLCVLPCMCILSPCICFNEYKHSDYVNPIEIEHFENNNMKNDNEASSYNDDEVYYNDYGVYNDGIKFV